MAGVTNIRLRLADDHRADLGGLPNEKGVSQPLQQGMTPQRVAGAFDADGDGGWQRGVELLDGVAGVEKLPVEQLARVGVPATCCIRVCRSQLTRIMSSASAMVTSWCSGLPRLPATLSRSHDISSAEQATIPLHLSGKVIRNPRRRRPCRPTSRSSTSRKRVSSRSKMAQNAS